MQCPSGPTLFWSPLNLTSHSALLQLKCMWWCYLPWSPVAEIFRQQIGRRPVEMILLRGPLLPLSALFSMWHMWINRCMPCLPLHCVASCKELPWNPPLWKKMVALPVLSSLGVVLLQVLHMVYFHASYKLWSDVTVSSHTGVQFVSRTVLLLIR